MDAGFEAVVPPDDGEHRELIDRLLATSGISEDTRDELEGYRADIAAGAFDDMNRRYVRALYARLITED